MFSRSNKRSVRRKYKKAGFPTNTKKSAYSTRAVVHSLRLSANGSFIVAHLMRWRDAFDEFDNSDPHGTIRRARRIVDLTDIASTC